MTALGHDPGVTADEHGLRGRVAVVIGGTGVLGGRMAAALARAGATTVVVGRDAARGAAAAAALRAEGGEITFAPCDAVERAALRDLVDRVVTDNGRVDGTVLHPRRHPRRTAADDQDGLADTGVDGVDGHQIPAVDFA